MSVQRIGDEERLRRALRTNTDSWVPIDLNSLEEKPPTKPTLGNTSLLYPGKRHVFSGPPESAKTLAAYCLLLQTVRQDDTAMLIDFEMGGYDARQRLRELGGTPDEIARIFYLEPEHEWSKERVAALVKLNPALVLVDAAAGAYQIEDLDDNKRSDVETFNRRYVTAFWRAGISTLLIDHVTKNSDDRGRFVIGSERKLGAADVHLGFEIVKPIARGSSGHYKLMTHKDRGGYLRRGHLADFHLDSDPVTHAIEWRFMSATGAGEDGVFRYTHLMEKASLKLELPGMSWSKSELADALKPTKRTHAFAAINQLVAEGFATETVDGRSKLVTSNRAYREADPACNPDTPESPAPEILCASPPRTDAS